MRVEISFDPRVGRQKIHLFLTYEESRTLTNGGSLYQPVVAGQDDSVALRIADLYVHREGAPH